MTHYVVIIIIVVCFLRCRANEFTGYGLKQFCVSNVSLYCYISSERRVCELKKKKKEWMNDMKSLASVNFKLDPVMSLCFPFDMVYLMKSTIKSVHSFIYSMHSLEPESQSSIMYRANTLSHSINKIKCS